MLGVQKIAAARDRTGPVDEDQVFRAQRDQMSSYRAPCGTRAVYDDLCLSEFSPREAESVRHRSADYDRRPVLIVVKDGDRTALLEFFLDLKAPRSGYILEVYSAETVCNVSDRLDERVDVFSRNAERESVDIRKFLEKK